MVNKLYGELCISLVKTFASKVEQKFKLGIWITTIVTNKRDLWTISDI